MKRPNPRRRSSVFTSTVTYTEPTTTTTTTTQPDDQEPPPIPVTVHFPEAEAATKIQSTYRAHLIRTLYRTISSVDSAAAELQREIQRQDTVDAVRASQRERLRVDEALMGLLLRLDAVPGGVDPAVREARRKVSRRIVGLQEIVDGVCRVEEEEEDGCGGLAVVMTRRWDEAVAEMEEEVCRERGGEEMERFCADYLGFRCLQRFLHEP